MPIDLVQLIVVVTIWLGGYAAFQIWVARRGRPNEKRLMDSLEKLSKALEKTNGHPPPHNSGN